MTVENKIPFYGDHVGNLLRSPAVKDARKSRKENLITAGQLRVIENQEIIKIVNKQKEVGLKAVTDGEFRRAWWHYDFLEQFDGVEGYQTGEPLHFKGADTAPYGIRVTGKIAFPNDHSFIKDYQFMHDITQDAVVKQTIPSPNMLFLRGIDVIDFYRENIEQYVTDLTLAYQKAIQAFYDAGCRYLQLDDTSWSIFFNENGIKNLEAKGFSKNEGLQLFTRLVNDSIAMRPKDLVITMHICRGNFRSTYFTSGGYDLVAEVIFKKLTIDALFLEFDDERYRGFEPLRLCREDLVIVLGLITSKTPELEDKESIKNLIYEAAKYVPLERLRLSLQCGFASTEEGNLLTEQQQWQKLKHVIEIAEEVWGKSLS